MTDLKNTTKMTSSANKAGYLAIGAHIAVSLVYVLYVGNGSPVVSLLFGTVLVALSGAAIAESEWPENKLSLLGVLGFVSMAFSYSVLLAGFGPLFKSDLESKLGIERYVCEHNGEKILLENPLVLSVNGATYFKGAGGSLISSNDCYPAKVKE